MAGKNIRGITVEIGGDATKLGKALENAETQGKNLSKELDQINKLLKLDPGNTDLLAQKQKVLSEAVDTTRKKLETLKNAEKQVQEQFKRGEVSEAQVRALQREIVETEQKMGNYEDAVKDTEKALRGMGDETEKVEKSSGNLGKVISGVAKGFTAAATTVVATGTALTGAFLSSAEATREYREEQGKLDAAFKASGKSAKSAETVYGDLFRVIGESDQSVEAAQQIALLAESEKDAAKWAGLASGVVGTFGDALQPETFYESANETLKLGEATGAYTQMLEGCGMSVEDFNKGLAACKTEEEKQAYMLATTEKAVGAAGKAYEEANADILAANEANAAFTESMANIGAAAEPVMTTIKSFGADVLNDLGPAVELIGEGMTGAMNGTKGATEKLAKGIGQAIDTVVSVVQNVLTKVVGMLPSLFTTILPVLMDGLTSLGSAIISALPGIISAFMAMLPGLISGLTQMFNEIVAVLPDLVNAIVSALPTLIPALITGLVSMIVTLCSNFASIIQPIIDALPNIIVSIVDALMTNLPALIQGAITLVIGIVTAIPQIIAGLLEAIPTVIVSIVEALIASAPVLWDGMRSIFTTARESIKSVFSSIGTFFKTVWNAITNVFANVGSWFKEKFTQAMSNVKNAWSSAKSVFSNIWSGIKNVFSNIGSWFKEKFTAAYNNAKNAWNNVKSAFSKIYSGIKNVFSNIGSWFKEKFTTAKNNVVNAWSNIKSKFSSIWSNIKSAFKFSDMASIGKNIIQGLWNGISNAATWLKNKISGFVGNVTSWLKNFFGINSPSTVMRDQVGRYLSEGIAEGITSDAPVKAMGEVGKDILASAEKIDPLTINRQLTTTFNSGATADNSILSRLDEIVNRLERKTQIVLDTGTLVGETIDKIDNGLAVRQLLSARGV